MNDFIMLPRSTLTADLWRVTNLSRLLLYLMGKADEKGMVTFNTTQLCKEFGWSRQQSRTLVAKLKAATGITTISTAIAITLAFNNQLYQSKRKPRQQPLVQPLSTPHNNTTQHDARDGFERFRDYFNSSVANTSIPQIMKLTDSRKSALRSIFKEYGKETVEVVIQKAIASDFLSRDWGKVSFDWIFKKANFLKILEGNYDNKPSSAARDTAASRKEQRDRGRFLAREIVSRSPDLYNLYNGEGTDPLPGED